MTNETTKELLALEGAQVQCVTLTIKDKKDIELSLMVSGDSKGYHAKFLSCIDGVDYHTKRYLEDATFPTAQEALKGARKFLAMRDDFLNSLRATFTPEQN